MNWALIVPALLLSLTSGCEQDVPPRTMRSDPSAETKPNKPVTRQAVMAVKAATAAATRLSASIEKGKPSHLDYLAMRREVMASRPYLRLHAQVGAEVLLGPSLSADEAGGRLGLLDRALADRDDEAAKKSMQQCLRALRVADNELMLNDVAPAAALRALPNVAFELGLMLMEAHPAVPDAPTAVRADLLGTLDAIERGVVAVLEVATPALQAKASGARDAIDEELTALRGPIEKARHSHALTHRARLVMRSGHLALRLRQLVMALGEDAKLPYPPRYPIGDNAPAKELLTPLSLPAARVDLRAGDRKAITAAGAKLFADKRLSKGVQRSCADCHQPDKAFADGLVVPSSLAPGKPITRNTPTLLYAPLNAAQLWDGRFASAEKQALRVIHEASEMGLDEASLVKAVEAAPELDQAMRAAFGDGVTAANIARALVAYQVAELVPGTSPMDEFARGVEAAFDDELHRGFDVFVGVGRCARCHVPPSFAGSRPTKFATPVFATLGVPVAPDVKRLDPDLGRGAVTKRPLDAHAFKTPTVRNIGRTAPYFHNGAFPTLEEVVDFYLEGGGRGRGLSVDNQDPDVRQIKLTPTQRDALIAFMRRGLADR